MTRAAENTPGWTHEVHELSTGFSAIVYDEHGCMVADHLTEERARLIAAAPEYAEAAALMIAAEQSGGDLWWQGFEMLKAAHAKAQGAGQ